MVPGFSLSADSWQKNWLREGLSQLLFGETGRGERVKDLNCLQHPISKPLTFTDVLAVYFKT